MLVILDTIFDKNISKYIMFHTEQTGLVIWVSKLQIVSLFLDELYL